MSRRAQKLVAIFLSALVLLTMTGLRAVDPGLLSALRGAGFDTLQRIWPRSMAEPQPVRIIDIDEASLRVLGQWPWPRTTLANLVNELNELGAAAIAFDIVFPEPDRLSPRRLLERSETAEVLRTAAPTLDSLALPDNDAIFALSIAGRPVVLSFASSGAGDASAAPFKAGFAQTGMEANNAPPRLQGITTNLDVLNEAATGIGSINIDLARDQGIARQIPFLWSNGERLLPALVPEALRVAQGIDTFLVRASPDTDNAIESLAVGDLEIPLSEQGQFHVWYRPDDPSLYVAASRVISTTEREQLRPLIEGHIVYVGTSAVGLLDVRTTALGETVAGVAIHAQATEQILSGAFLTRPEWAVGAEFITVMLAGIALILLGALIKPWKTVLAFLAMAGLALTVVAIAFKSFGILIDATFPLFSLALTFLTAIAMRLLVTDRESRKLRSAFGQYVAPAVLSEIESNPDALKLGGEMRDVTVMFVDIVNFTPLGEKLPPQDLVRVVNRLLDAASKAILAERGTIDKYIGDAVMAFWNAPVSIKDHQYRAACAALGARQAVAKLNEEPEIAALLSKHEVPPLAVRIGLASGQACVGNMGSEERFDYSVIGETVNIASRAEGSCKAIGYSIAIAGDVAKATMALALIPAGHVAMKGKTAHQPLHVLVGDEHLATSTAFADCRTQLAELTKTLAAHRRGNMPLAHKSLIAELAAQHPDLETYIYALSDRITDFKTV